MAGMEVNYLIRINLRLSLIIVYLCLQFTCMLTSIRIDLGTTCRAGFQVRFLGQFGGKVELFGGGGGELPPLR